MHFIKVLKNLKTQLCCCQHMRIPPSLITHNPLCLPSGTCDSGIYSSMLGNGGAVTWNQIWNSDEWGLIAGCHLSQFKFTYISKCLHFGALKSLAEWVMQHNTQPLSWKWLRLWWFVSCVLMSSGSGEIVALWETVWGVRLLASSIWGWWRSLFMMCIVIRTNNISCMMN